MPQSGLNLTVVVLIEGIPTMFGNSSTLLKSAIVEQMYLTNAKIQELRIEQAADKIVAIPTSDGDEPLAH